MPTDGDGDDSLLHVLEHARRLKDNLDIARLERMLFIYRTWITSPQSFGVDVGYSLTEDELACVLEYPSDPQHVQYLMDTFRVCTEPSPRVDFLTLLAACTCVARGGLEAKARFLFRLVDLDTEDEIAEDELAMLVSLCSDGLHRIGIVLTELEDADAKAIAWEAFEFVGVDEGDKMSFAAFSKWLASHHRPAALFDRLQSLMMLSSITQRLHNALASRLQAEATDPFTIFNSGHFGDDQTSGVENIRVLVGPIVGPVTQNEVRILMEVNHDALVRCFAFLVGASQRCVGRSKLVDVFVNAYSPTVIILGGLEPCTTYQFRFLGVCRVDRERCIAIATTRKEEEDVTVQSAALWSIRVLNHANTSSTDNGGYRNLSQQSYLATEHQSSLLTVHLSCIQVSEATLKAVSRLLATKSERDRLRAQRILMDQFRSCLQRPGLFDLFRCESNLIYTTRQFALHSGNRSGFDAVMMQEIYEMAVEPWRLFLGSLWELKTDIGLTSIHIDRHCLFLSGGSSNPHDLDARLLAAPPATQDLICITEEPFIPRHLDSSDAVDSVLTSMMPLIEWKRQKLSRNVVLVSQDSSAGYHVQLVVKNTTISIPQLACAPIASRFNGEDQQHIMFPDHSLASTLIVATPVPAHYVDIACHLAPPPSRPGTQASSSRPTSQSSTSRPGSQLSTSRPATRGDMRSSHGERGAEATQLKCNLTLLEDKDGVQLVVGPLVANVSSHSATIIVQGDRTGEMMMRLVDSVTGEERTRWVSTLAQQPVRVKWRALQPRTEYSIWVQNTSHASFRTPSHSPPSMRVLLIGDDRFCDEFPVVSRAAMHQQPSSSVVGEIVGDLSPPAIGGAPQFDLTIQISSTISLRHDLMQGLAMLRVPSDGSQDLQNEPVEDIVRRCFQIQASQPHWRSMMAKNGRVFTHLGLCRKLIQSGAPQSLLRAVKKAVTEFEHNDNDCEGAGSLMHTISPEVTLFVLDTTDWVMEGHAQSFAEWPESLLTPRQMTGLAAVLGQPERSTPARSRQLIIVSDAPLVWPFPTTVAQAEKMLTIRIASDPWSYYSHDVRTVLDMVFSAIQKQPLLRVSIVTSAAFSSRVVVSSKRSSRCIEQLTVGPVSNLDYPPNMYPAAMKASIDLVSGRVGEDFMVVSTEAEATSHAPRQYCVLDIVPHTYGATCLHTFYTGGKPSARIILGPIIGRVTSRAARVLIEVDRAVQKAVCTFTALTGAAGHTVSVESALEPFTPTIFKAEGLHPGTRYQFQFEGLLLDSQHAEVYHVETPPPAQLTVEWMVFSRNNLRLQLPPKEKSNASHWHRILEPGTQYYQAHSASAVAVKNGDVLGSAIDVRDDQYNPWHHAEAFGLSKPLRVPQLCIHLGGQVDLSTAFSDEELGTLVVRLTDPHTSEETKTELFTKIRFRLQDVYRITWGVEPLATVLGYTSNLMLLHDRADVFFSVGRLREILARATNVTEYPSEDALASIAHKLRGMAFELWQLYQNQLWVDVNESDLDNSRRNSSKFGYVTTFGMCRIAMVNISDELRGLAGNSSDSTDATIAPQVTPLTLPTATAATAASDVSQLLLLSSATWKTLDEALEIADSSSNTTTKSKAKKTLSPIKHVVVCLPVDVIDIVTRFPAVRGDVVRLWEKLFQWKKANRSERTITIICASEAMCSHTITVTDEKMNETLTLHRVSSIAEPKNPPTAGGAAAKKKTKSSKDKSGVAVIKGYFSKRFTYASTSLSSSSLGGPPGTKYRSYAKFQFLSDYRRGVISESVLNFPALTLPSIVVGPVIGRIVVRVEEQSENQGSEPQTLCSVPILIEVSVSARVACVVIDSMSNTETRVVLELQAHVPRVYCVHGLTPLRRYVFFFEGVANSDDRRGSFHTPPSQSEGFNLVAVSSSFPTHMDEDRDSLWVPQLERAKLPWCGLDAVLHLGGQVPLHEAAVECFAYATSELSKEILHGDRTVLAMKRLQQVRAKVRRRFQQEYHVCWNLPVIRELLACVSNWFVHGKVDVAPVYGHEGVGVLETSVAARLVVDVAVEVVKQYQLQLMTAIDEEERERLEQARAKLESELTVVKPHTTAASPGEATSKQEDSEASPTDTGTAAATATSESTATVEDAVDPDTTTAEDPGGAVFWQHGDVSVFVCDTRSASLSVGRDEEVPSITCNGRLSRPLSRQENSIIGEQQWRYLESALKKKRTLLFILCLELPLILTDAAHVDKLRDDLRLQGSTNPWSVYDHKHITQHYVSCKRQLEQLLLILFKWKAKRAGRDVLVLSGSMRVGLDTLLQDRESKLSIRNLTAGPVTAKPERFDWPQAGVACPTIAGGIKDDHFTFRHTLHSEKSYLLLHASTQDQPNSGRSAVVQAAFISSTDPATLSQLHSIDKFRRLPLWWTQYIPMGQSVFWDDTITLKGETDERMTALREYLWLDKGFAGALEVFYEQFQFAETARLEDLRSRHLQHVDMQSNFNRVLEEVWRQVLPEAKRRQMAYFLDPFVKELLLGHVAPRFYSELLPSGEAIELVFFCRVVREFVWDACLLSLAIETQRQDEIDARRRAVEKQRREEEMKALELIKQEQLAREEAQRMDELLRTDPLEYARIKLAKEADVQKEREARHEEKLARKKAERLAELEEEQAIAKEQKKLNKLAEKDPVAYEQRSRELETRVRQLEERRAQRAAQKKKAAA